jgi:thymidylate kinase
MRAQPGNAHRHLVLRFGSRSSRRGRGGLVAFVGPDGSGKSTVIRTLTERARSIPGLKVRTTYLGPWGQMKLTLVPALRKLGITPTVLPSGLHLASGTHAKDGSKRSQIRSLLKGSVFYAALYVELIYRYATSVFFRVRRGDWVVADRYITDLRYLYKERPIANYGTIRRFLCAVYPKPDLFIVLDNRPDVIVSRKGGLAAAQIETLRHFMLMAARNYRFEVVTTDRPPEEIADHVLNRMLSMRALK